MRIVGSKINSSLATASCRIPLRPSAFRQPGDQFVRRLIPPKTRGMIKRRRHLVRNPSVLVHHSNERPVLMVPVRIQNDSIEYQIAGHLSKGCGLLLRIREHIEIAARIFSTV